MSKPKATTVDYYQDAIYDIASRIDSVGDLDNDDRRAIAHAYMRVASADQLAASFVAALGGSNPAQYLAWYVTEQATDGHTTIVEEAVFEAISDTAERDLREAMHQISLSGSASEERIIDMRQRVADMNKA